MGQKTWYWAAEGGEDTPYATCGCSEIHTGGRKSSQELKAENMYLFSYQSTHRNHLLLPQGTKCLAQEETD